MNFKILLFFLTNFNQSNGRIKTMLSNEYYPGHSIILECIHTSVCSLGGGLIGSLVIASSLSIICRCCSRCNRISGLLSCRIPSRSSCSGPINVIQWMKKNILYCKNFKITFSFMTIIKCVDKNVERESRNFPNENVTSQTKYRSLWRHYWNTHTLTHSNEIKIWAGSFAL